MASAHRVLVPFELPDADTLPSFLIASLESLEVVVLGHFGLPEQTPAAIARDQFGTEAQAELDELAASIAAVAESVETRLVFGKDRAKVIDGVAVEEGCDVVLTPGRADRLGRILVPLRGADNLDRITSFVADLLAGTDASVTLFHATDETDRQPGAVLLADAAARLTSLGVDSDRIDQELVEGDPRASIVEAGKAFDVLVIGESEPTLRERILGALPAAVTAESADPTFVVRTSGPEQ